MKKRLPLKRAIILFFGVGIALSAHAESNIGRFELLHLWAQPAEQKALRAFTDPLNEAGIEWEEHFVSSNFKGIRESYSRRVAMGIPPTGTSWIGGSNLKYLVESGSFRLIPNKIGDKRFSDMLIEPVYEVLKYKDGISALPVGIHVQNHVIYNKAILDEIGRDIPNNWDEFIELAPIVKNAGYVPISISSEAWQLRSLILSLISENFAREEITHFFNSDVKLDFLKSHLLKIFDVLSELRPYINDDYVDLGWQRAVEKVGNKKALANFLGDYTSPLVEDNPDVVCAAPPGNDDILWSFDVIAFSNEVNAKEFIGQDLFATTVMNPSNNKSYIAHKGGLPVFKTDSYDSFNRCTKFMLKRWDDTPDRLHISASNWTKQLNIITTVAQDFLGNHSKTSENAAQEIIKSIFEMNMDR